MMKISVNIVFLVSLIIVTMESSPKLPNKNCHIREFYKLENEYGKDNFYKKTLGIVCDVNGLNFKNEIDNKTKGELKKECISPGKNCSYSQNVEFKWSKNLKVRSITKQFNLTALITYLYYITRFGEFVYIQFVNLNRIELNLVETPSSPSYVENYIIQDILLINSDLTFTIDGKTVNTCEEIVSSVGITRITSIFQMSLAVHYNSPDDRQDFYLLGCRYPHTLCPLVFINADILTFYIYDLTDTFYKRNVLRFSNETFPYLSSRITELDLFRCENIVLDTSLLNPFVFNHTYTINIIGFVRSISNDLFTSLKKLQVINFLTGYFRKFVHLNGIEWLKGFNRNFKVNLTSYQQKDGKTINLRKVKFVFLRNDRWFQVESISNVFPDADFCLYKDYPFEQLVFIVEYSSEEVFTHAFKRRNREITCTYLWVNQYTYLLKKNEFLNDSDLIWSLSMLIDTDAYENINSCNFSRRLSLCSRSEYNHGKIKDIWGREDFYLLNKKIETAIKSLTYLIAFCSISTNTFVIILIFSKHNNHLFKDFKHYHYLGLISVFYIFISIIEILSWLTECFYPFEVFCPGVYRTIVAQLFKMVFKECFVTLLRFVANFCYIAFAINRIGLISRQPGCLIRLMADFVVWKYVLVSFLISIVFSWIKYFKYSINNGRGELAYPISNEHDITTDFIGKPRILDFYFIFSCISDLLNYLVFLIACLVSDIIMLVKLRTTVNESIDRMKKLQSNSQQLEKKTSELEDTVNQSVRMVVLNTAIGLLFKLPMVFLPIVNAIAEFYYKNTITRNSNPGFDRFYSKLIDTGFYSIIQESSELLFLISMSLQFFIYRRFDKKIKKAFLFKQQNDQSALNLHSVN